MSSETNYLKTADGFYIAYQVVGNGPVDVAFGFDYAESNIDLMWEDPDWRPFMVGTAEFARVILHDARGAGVSSRNVPPANLETRAADLLAVLDEVGSAQPILASGSEPGAMHALFAATHPDRVSALLWNNPAGRMAWAPDYPWGAGPEEFEQSMQRTAYWGTAEYARALADLRAAERAGVREQDLPPQTYDWEQLNLYARIFRNTVTPDVARAMIRIVWDTDCRGVLPSVRAPAALIVGRYDNVAEAEYIASLMPSATVHVIEGRAGAAVGPVLAILRGLAGLEPPAPVLDTVLASVVFTDIVDSTARQSSLGDRKWKDIIRGHHEIVRQSLARWRGVENDTAGDGFFMTFDGPARAIRCAMEITERVRGLGIEIRAGVHTGECELIENKHAGIAVAIGARIAASAGPSQVVVSQTVKDLVAGSGFTFEDAGEHELKGVPDRWHLYRVSV